MGSAAKYIDPLKIAASLAHRNQMRDPTLRGVSAMLGWYGHDVSRSVGRVREPISGESFAGIQERAQSLLREAIQNSLDARVEPARPVRIRIHISCGGNALPAAAVKEWFSTAWPHIKADPKLRDFDPTEPCPFLTIEDFNTRGLQGDLRERAPDEDTRNAWCLFFRKEGQSAKGTAERGRWGIGKVVFPLCSEAHLFIAATVRHDDRQRLVMGQGMLRSRTVAGKKYLPDLWYCEPLGQDELELPSSSAEAFQRLKNAFHLQRSDEPGLSVVIPYIDASITRSALIVATVKEFFFPILNGTLVVEITSPSDPFLVLDQSTLPSVRVELAAAGEQSTLDLVELARWYLENTEPPITAALPPGLNGLDWSPEQLTVDHVAQLKTTLASGEPVHILIPMPVLPKHGAPLQGTFDLILQRTTEKGSRRPVFVRSDLVIPEVKARQVRGFLALLVAREPNVSRMLGDAENPAHTDWSRHSSNFNYTYPDKHLSYVRQSAHNVCALLDEPLDDVSEDALAEFFAVEIPEDGTRPRPKKGSGGDVVRPDIPPPTSKPRPFAISRVAGGYSVRSTQTPFPAKSTLRVLVGYDTRRGDPVKRYDPADFDVSRLNVVLQGLRVLEREKNRLLLLPTDPSFSLQVSGFDEKRDLVVRVNEVAISQ